MGDNFGERLITLFLLLPAFVAGLTVHEFAHAWAATKLGDDTAQRQGRLTLDPMAHLDPLGFGIIVFSILFGAPLIGWAKPVPFNPRNLEHPRRDAILIAIAGPISNVLQTVVWLFGLWALFQITRQMGGLINSEGVAETVLTYRPQLTSVLGAIMQVCLMGVLLNISLAVFNMIPIPPLDGHYVLEGLGPPFITDLYDAIRPYSFMLLLLLLWTGVLSQILTPVSLFSLQLARLAMGLPA